MKSRKIESFSSSGLTSVRLSELGGGSLIQFHRRIVILHIHPSALHNRLFDENRGTATKGQCNSVAGPRIDFDRSAVRLQ